MHSYLYIYIFISTMNHECVLCYDEVPYIGITECNHGPFCYRCIYKMRVISKNNACPICKAESKQVVISDLFENFGEFSQEIFPDKFYSDVFYAGEKAKKEFEKLTQYKCFVKFNGKPCKHDKKFPNIAFLKKHLKEDHKRSFCDICLDKKTCVLEEQKLYTQAQLTRHLERGDIDEYGNIVFMHPYCGFCKEYFFDDDSFRIHLGFEHFTCNVCGKFEKYRYYKNYDSLQVHYKISHYICTDANCLAKKFIAFRSAEELKIHRYQVHDNSGLKRIDGRELCNFHYEGHENQEDFIEIKDNEGIDMENEFLTLKKAKNRALGEPDVQEDTIIDMRVFFPSSMEEDEHFKESFVLKHRKQDEQRNEDEQFRKKQGKKKKYMEKNEFEKQKPQIAKENETFYIQDLNLMSTTSLSRLRYDQFEDKLADLINSEDLKKVEGWKTKFNRKNISSKEFITNFLELMKKFSLRCGYEIFPHFIRTFQNENSKRELDEEYVYMLKQIKSKSDSLLVSSHLYSDLFFCLMKEIEKSIESRIVEGKLSIKKPIKRQKQRLFQIIGVLRRLKTEEMVKLKFANNFGVDGDTIELVHEKIFKMNKENIPKRLAKIPNEELIDLYVFIKYCHEAIKHSENMNIAKHKINQNILEDFLFDRPYLYEQYGIKKEELKTLEEKVEYEKQQEERKEKKRLKELDQKNKNLGYHAKTNFNLEDKGDFPELSGDKKKEQQTKQDFKQIMNTGKQKPATYQKKIQELFPTLGSEPQTAKKEEQVKADKQKEKQWWQTINEKKVDLEEESEVKVRKGKKKKEKWVAVKGLFGN